MIETTKKLLQLTIELEQTSYYWNELPLGIHNRIKEAKNDCLTEINAEIKQLKTEADTLVKFAAQRQGAKQSDLMEQSYAVREQAGLLQQWLDKVLSYE